ncbi:MAG: fibronectin type III domain-containing protein, partial [Candidatus Carbobacillus sp.]|nr:fibronectin type III domain-containing protein [Candidatus Carbobacillus sp.]
MKKTFLLLLAFIAFWGLQVNGQWSVTNVATDFTIDFDNTVAGVNQGAFAGTGFAITPSDGQLNTNTWAAFAGAKTKDFGVESTDVVFKQGSSTGGVASGGVYAFEVETDNVAFGIQPSGTVFSTGYIALKMQNNTGADVNSVDFSYDIWELNDQNRSTNFNGEYSLDGSTWVVIPEALYATGLTSDPSAAWAKTPIAISLSVDIPIGGFFYFRWNMSENGGSGSRDEIAFDNVTVNMTAAAPLSDENDILTFVLAEQTGAAIIDNIAKTVTIEVAFETDLTALTPTITISDNATIVPNSGVAVDFTTSPVAYTVTSESGIDQVWNVSVTEAAAPLSDENDILTFILAEQTGAANINTTAKTVLIEVANGTVLTALTPTITISDNATIIPNSGVAVDFTTSPVAYTVTSESGIAQVWNVTVTEAAAPLSDDNDILTFILAEQTGAAIIDNIAKTVTIEVAFGTDLATLTPTITISDNATIIPNSGVEVDFTTSPVAYTVTSESGIAQVWNVTVTTDSGLSNQKDILTFAIYGQIGSSVIGANTIDVEMGWQSNVAGLTPTLTVSALATVSPVSGQTQDFTNPLTYTVTAENGTTKEYIVTVAKEETPLGANCENPFIVQIPTDLPYDHAATTCGLGNIYNLPSTNYDNGDDAIYRLDVTGGAVVKITMSPELSQTGLFLFDDCPNIGTLINSVTNTDTTDRVLTASLPAGTYYVMVDKNPMPRCFPYELAIEELCLPPTDIQTANISATSSDIHWTAGGFETTWSIKVNQGVAIDPLTVDGDIVADTVVSGTPEFTIPVALNSLTTYYVYIKSGCGSDWVEYMFATPSSCPIPTDLTSTVTGANSASISWTELGMSSWLIKVSTSSLTNPDGQTADIEDNTEVTGTGEFNLTGLTANTTYYWTVKSACGSPWATQKSFTTDCGIASIPYLQDFETAVVPGFPECTSAENLGTGNMWKTSSNPGYGFTTKVLHYNYSSSSPANTWFYTEPVQLVAGTSYRLTFKYGSNSTSYAEKLKVMYGTNAASTAMAYDIVDYTAISNNTPNVSETDFIPSESGTYYLGFNCYSATNQYHLYVDDIFLDITPTCLTPTNLQSNNVTTNSADILWTQIGTPDSWNIKVSTQSIDPSVADGDIIANQSTTNNPFTVNGLQSGTRYYFYVQANCGGGDLSYWSDEGMFFTTCEAFAVPYTENFDTWGTGANAFPDCWTRPVVYSTGAT